MVITSLHHFTSIYLFAHSLIHSTGMYRMLAQCRSLDPTHLSSEEKLQLFHRWGIRAAEERSWPKSKRQDQKPSLVAPANPAHSLGSCEGSLGDFLGGPVVKNLPCNTGDTGSILGQETEIPQASEQISPRITTTEARVPQLQSLCTAMKDPECRN